MPYTYTLTTVIPATPQEIYEAWLDSVAHSQMTGGDASISDEVGAEFSAWDEYITGHNLELVPGERIVQSWRTDKFPDEHADSTVTITFEDTDGGTLLTLVHSDVPDDQRDYEEGGWEENYFEPMKAYFAKRAGEAPDAEPSSVSPPQPDEEPRRAAGRKSRKAAPRVKVSRATKKAKRTTAVKAKRKTAKSSPKKLAKRKTTKPSPKKLVKRKPRTRKSSRRPRAHR
jgi:uncharacterized protein YndB with AHSA1/START domain